MKYFPPVAAWAISVALVALYSCNDPSVIGSDLLSGDELNIDFTDTVSLRAYSVEVDSVRSFSPSIVGVTSLGFPFGEFQDPVFGKTSASVSFMISLNANDPDFEGEVLDSMVLILPYQASQVYGDTNQTYGIEVLELNENLSRDSTYYTDREFALKSMILGAREFIPRPKDSIVVKIPGSDSTGKVPPQLRIPMTEEFRNAFFTANPDNFENDSTFRAFFKGIHIRPNRATAGLLSFNLRNSAAGLRVFYHKDSVFSEYLFPILSSNVVTSHFDNDYTGTVVGSFLNDNVEENDSIIFLQGMSGTNVVIEIPYAASLENILVNRAELEIPFLRLPGDDVAFGGVDQVVISQIVNDTTITLLSDVQFAINRSGSSFPQIFGGFLTSDGTYKLNISSYFQDLMRGEASSKLLITVYSKAEKTARAALGGPAHSAFPAKINLSFTRL
jgi:hypothetical protein